MLRSFLIFEILTLVISIPALALIFGTTWFVGVDINAGWAALIGVIVGCGAGMLALEATA